MKQLLFFSILLYLFTLVAAGCAESENETQNYPSVSKDLMIMTFPVLKENDFN